MKERSLIGQSGDRRTAVVFPAISCSVWMTSIHQDQHWAHCYILTPEFIWRGPKKMKVSMTTFSYLEDKFLKKETKQKKLLYWVPGLFRALRTPAPDERNNKLAAISGQNRSRFQTAQTRSHAFAHSHINNPSSTLNSDQTHWWEKNQWASYRHCQSDTEMPHIRHRIITESKDVLKGSYFKKQINVCSKSNWVSVSLSIILNWQFDILFNVLLLILCVYLSFCSPFCDTMAQLILQYCAISINAQVTVIEHFYFQAPNPVCLVLLSHPA